MSRANEFFMMRAITEAEREGWDSVVIQRAHSHLKDVNCYKRKISWLHSRVTQLDS